MLRSMMRSSRLCSIPMQGIESKSCSSLPYRSNPMEGSRNICWIVQLLNVRILWMTGRLMLPMPASGPRTYLIGSLLTRTPREIHKHQYHMLGQIPRRTRDIHKLYPEGPMRTRWERVTPTTAKELIAFISYLLIRSQMCTSMNLRQIMSKTTGHLYAPLKTLSTLRTVLEMRAIIANSKKITLPQRSLKMFIAPLTTWNTAIGTRMQMLVKWPSLLCWKRRCLFTSLR